MRILGIVLSIAGLLLALSKCEAQRSDACIHTPCQNEGTCLINSQDSAEFLCLCPPFFNGTTCENYIVLCGTGVCSCNILGSGNGSDSWGSYTRLIMDDHWQNSPSVCSEGPVNCQDKPCLNGGTCFQGVNNTTWCQCPDRYSGVFCQELTVSRCESNPCENNGVCTPHEDTFSCNCAPGYAGVTCSLLITTRCASEPCQNGGTCFVSSVDVQQYFCVCAAGYTGEQCHEPVTECSCDNGGHCEQISLPAGDIDLRCVCPSGYSGAHCDIAPANVCDEEPCVNGTCFLHGANQSEYFCDCFEGFIGYDCSIPVQQGSCSSNPCLNSGSCSPVITSSGTEYTHCECPPGYMGIYCETSAEGCAPNPCLNGGLCLASSPTSVTCQCAIGFVGSRCQYEGACHSNPCQNNGTCYNAYQPQDDLELPSYACECQGIYRGVNCNETLDPCSSNPCQNGGICLKNEDDVVFLCICTVEFTGNMCERPIGACSSNPCQNGGICLEKEDGDAFFCICTVEFTGEVCDRPIGETCTLNPTACDGFGEICVDDADGNSFHCECQEYWLRNTDNSSCHAPCSMNPCVNSGRCFLEGEDFFCVCPEGFTGFLCEKPIAPCDGCKNGGFCVEFSTGFYCECVDGFTGIDCSVPPQIDTTTPEPDQLCPAGACQNGGTCQPFAEVGFHCICPEGYTGLDCSVVITTTTSTTKSATTASTMTTSTMTSSAGTTSTTPTTRMVIANKGICTVFDPCENNAICLPNTNHKGELYPMCVCQPGYAGATCSVKLPTPSVCLGNPCGPDAQCYSDATTVSGFSCLCLLTDRICADNYFAGSTPTPTGSPSLCETNPCKNGGTCEVIGADTFSCICPPYIVGDICETDIRDCVYKDSRYTEGDVRSNGCIKCNCSNGDWQCTDDDCYCEHENKLYENGQTWTDQCMTCFCYNGGWLCSDSDCSNTCEHEGSRYFSGDIREESCETCFCRNGDWTCTEKDCDFCVDGDAVYLEGAVRRADCNLCTCSKKEWMCTIKDCDELPLIISVIFHLDYPFSLIEDRQDQLIRVITAYLETRYDLQESQLMGIQLSDGSVVVNITLQETQGTDQDVRYIADQISERVHSGSLYITFDGFQIPAKNDSYSVTIFGLDDEEDSIIFLVSLSACLALLVIVAGFLVVMCLFRQHTKKIKRGSSQKQKLWRSSGSESSQDIPLSNATDDTWQNAHDKVEEGNQAVHNVLQKDRVMTCPGRLRQKGLEGI